MSMDFLFDLILPKSSYYSFPENKESLRISLKEDDNKIILTKLLVKEGKRLIKKKEIYLKEEEKKALKDFFDKEGDLLKKGISTYKPLEGISFIHTYFQYKGNSCLLPDYLANFRADDIFHRYKYYPNQERVKFYSSVRELYKIIFKIISYSDNLPIFDKTPYVFRNGALNNLILPEDFE